MNWRNVLALMAMVAVAPGAQAQPAAAPVALTLDDAIAKGLTVSHRLAEAVARRQSADAGIALREAASRPQLAALAGYMRTNHVEEFGVPLPNNELRVIYPDVPDNYRARLEAQWPLYTGGRA